MMILGAICCRGGSKGVPGKNIRLLNGKPLVAYTIETACHCTMLDDVIVSTDSEEIANIAIEYGAKVPFIRPASLATDEASKWPVFLHAVEKYEELFSKEISYIVDMDVTVPLKTAADIDGAIKMALLYPETDVVITGYVPEKNPYFNMFEITNKGYAEIVKKSDEPIVRRQDAPKVLGLSGAAFVIKKSALYNYTHWSQAVCRVYEMPRERALDIDEEIDFELIKLLLNSHSTH
jgi:CMP-N,N'-diacetyllegionaminic acid synthase